MPDAVLPMVLQRINLDIVPGKIPPIVYVSEYDTGREIVVYLFIDGYPYGKTSENANWSIKVEGSIGEYGFSEDASWADDSDEIVFHLTEAMTAIHGRVWTKIKITDSNGQRISTCGFWLDCDRAGVEAETLIGAPGFEEQIQEAVNDWLDEHGGGGSGLTDEVKSALMNVASHIGAWTDGNAQTYVQALHDALYPPANLSFITAVFAPGQNVIYTTDTLDTLKQYLTITAHYSDSSTQIVTSYTLSGTLRAGQSTITVLYGGKSTTFTVTVVDRDAIPSEYQKVEYIEATGTQYLNVGAIDADTNLLKIETAIAWTDLADIQLMLGDGGWYFGLESGSYRIAMNKNLVAAQQNVFQDVSIEMTRYAPRESGSYSIGGTTGNVSVYYSLATNMKLNLFGLGGNSLVRPCKCRMKSTKLTVTNRSNVTTTYNLIPCYRKADGEIGMYDAESGTFLTNAGTGAFLKGGNI